MSLNGMASIGDIVAYLRMDSKNFTKNARAASGQMKSMNKGFGGMAAAASRGGLAVTGIGSAVGLASKAFGDTVGFDRAMARSLAIQDVSDSTSKSMIDAARKTSESTQFSATEAAEAYFFLASAGLSAEEQINSMETVAKFAQAGNFDLALATDLVTDAQSALGLSAGTAAQKLQGMKQVAGTLIKANSIANASVQEFSTSLTNQAAVMGTQFGESISEILAVMSVFADQGFAKGAEAGTKYSMVLRDLTTKAITSGDAFKQSGIKVFDSNGKFVGVRKSVEQLTDRLAGMSDEAKKAELLRLGFTDKAIGGIAALLGKTNELTAAAEKLNLTWEQGGNVLDAVADKSITKFDKKLNRLNAQWERFSANTVGPGVDWGITPLLDGTNQWIESAVDGTKQWYDAITTGWMMTGRAMEAALIGENPIKAAAGVDPQTGFLRGAGQKDLMTSMERFYAMEAQRKQRAFTQQQIGRERSEQSSPFGTALPSLGDVFRGGVSPPGTDGASLGDGGGAAATVQAITEQNELLLKQLEELKKLNSDTDIL